MHAGLRDVIHVTVQRVLERSARMTKYLESGCFCPGIESKKRGAEAPLKFNVEQDEII